MSSGCYQCDFGTLYKNSNWRIICTVGNHKSWIISNEYKWESLEEAMEHEFGLNKRNLKEKRDGNVSWI